MRETRELIEFWKANSKERLILATITEAQGSTYRKVGAKKIITVSGHAKGLLSGGCLEAEIAKDGAGAIGAQQSGFSKVYDSTSESDRFFGYQKGCLGKISVYFESLPAYSPKIEAQYFPDTAKKNRVIIFGCGADSLPVYELCDYMGWDVTLVDHRESYAQASAFPNAKVIHASYEKAVDNVAPESCVVVMTHNYEADLHILKSLKEQPPRYLGFLGPRSRFEQLCGDLQKVYGETISSEVKEKIFAPIGSLKKAHQPSEIALSIVSQIASLN